jgi:hypothetical protein
VTAWSDDYGLTPQIDACVLGAGMYPGYEQYWTPIQDEPGKVHPMTCVVPTPAEVEWGQFARRTPHYVLSRTLTSVASGSRSCPTSQSSSQSMRSWAA